MRPRLHKVLSVTAASVAVLALLGPGSGAAFSQSEEKPITVGVVHNLANHPSIQAIIQGFNDEAKHFPIKYIYLDPAYDPQKQVAMIEDLISQKVDVIAVNAVDPDAIIPALKDANAAGIPVVMHNADVSDAGRQYVKTFISPKLYPQGQAVGALAAKDLNCSGNLVIISGKAGQTGVLERTQGFKDAVTAACPGAGFNYLAEQYANWAKDEAVTVMQDFLTRYPNIDAVYALDDYMAVGALQSIDAAGMRGKIKVYGVGGTKEGCQAVKAGDMQGSAFHFSYLVGVYTARAAWDAAHGRPLTPYIEVPTMSLDRNNVDAVNAYCW
jgi:ABC-type sugar transport system substrate-binding protein